MGEWDSLGKFIIKIGLCVAAVGFVMLLSVDRLPKFWNIFGWVGKLPGDFFIHRDNFSFSFPFVTSLLVSIFLSLLFYLIAWIFRR